MVSSTGDDDFALYSYSDQFPAASNYSTSSSYAEHFYTPGSTFESYPSQQAYTFPPQADFYSAPHVKSNLPMNSPVYSPANSVAPSFDLQPPMLSSTTDSCASGPSSISSARASPSLSAQAASDWARQSHSRHPGIVGHDNFGVYGNDEFDIDTISSAEKVAGCVDPSLIEPYSSTPVASAAFPDFNTAQSPTPMFPTAPSPTQSHISLPHTVSGPMRTSSRNGQSSWAPYSSSFPQQRRASISSQKSIISQSSFDSSDESRGGVCPIPSCGRHIKDLKSHMLTHQNERPEKCPIPSCEYHTKGFARKYDKNRHTLTHYKGTMVCGFCLGSGSASEKSFNRADVFKRHLTSVHGVEQTAPNARRRSPGAMSKRGYQQHAGTCSTCGVTFANAQAFYEHLDDCVLRVVQQIDPSEAINERLLTSMADDKNTNATLSRHNLPTDINFAGPTSFTEGDDEDEIDDKSSKRKGKNASQ